MRLTRTMASADARTERLPELLLRLGVAGCFVGHGAFGVIGKAAWLPYFAAVGIGEDLAWRLMPIVGTIDILVGTLVLFAPRPALLLYAIGWAAWTALLRPLAGESFFETLERAGNYGVPLALLLMAGAATHWRRWLEPLRIRGAEAASRRQVEAILRATTVALLLGHGGLALLGKPLLAGHLAAIGLPAGSTVVMGVVDVALAAWVAFRRAEPALPIVIGWKLATEALFPITGDSTWEFVERAGSYIAPLTLWIMMRQPAPRRAVSRAPARLGVIAATTILIAAAMPPAGVPGTRDVGASAKREKAGTWAAVAAVPAVALATLAGAPGASSSPERGEVGWGAAVAAAAEGQDADSVLDRLRAGGFVLACRHAITGPDPRNRRFDLEDRSTQRLLSAEGEAQARRLGEILRRQRIPIGEVLTSPVFRTSDSAELTFGRAERSDALWTNEAQDTAELRRLFTSEPAPGTNRALMTHQGILYPITELERGSIREGDCVIIDPDGGDSFEIVDVLGPDEWAALRSGATQDTQPLHEPAAFRASQTSQASEAARAIAAARRGGMIIVCRHAITGSTSEVEPVDYEDPATQRLLSPEGERQSAAMGRAFRRLGIEVSRVIASPMHRAHRTAELMFGRPPVIDSIWHTNGSDYGGPPRGGRLHVLATPVPNGNHVIISHIGTMASVIPEAEGDIGQGDCVVVQPAGETFHVVGVVPWRAWSYGDT